MPLPPLSIFVMQIYSTPHSSSDIVIESHPLILHQIMLPSHDSSQFFFIFLSSHILITLLPSLYSSSYVCLSQPWACIFYHFHTNPLPPILMYQISQLKLHHVSLLGLNTYAYTVPHISTHHTVLIFYYNCVISDSFLIHLLICCHPSGC